MAPGHSGVVHLFEWPWADVALECERFLGPKRFGAVQVSPPHENPVVDKRPWWERYQVVSYKISSRSGNEAQFSDMVKRCNAVGVRIYVDAVINHMSAKTTNTMGTGGSMSDPVNLHYPAVPYGPNDFNPVCEIKSYDDVNSIRNCELVGMHDLNQKSNHVRTMIINYLNKLVDMGVAGFRIDAAKHMWPSDLNYIYNNIKFLNISHGFVAGSKPFIYQEVIHLAPTEAIKSAEYTRIGRVTEFKYGAELSNAFRGNNKLKYFQNFGIPWGLLDERDALVFIDNHDNQRGHGGGGSILTYKTPRQYKMAIAFMLAYPFGVPRIMSSFAFDDSDSGPPQDGQGNILSPNINRDGTCGNGWICEHRWREIYNMVQFRSVVKGTTLNDWWDNGANQISFCRGDKGFIAFNGDSYDLKQTLQTCLPQGIYCDVISGKKENNLCTGKTIVVDEMGLASIEILQSDFNGVLAIHQESTPPPQLNLQACTPPTKSKLPFGISSASTSKSVFMNGETGMIGRVINEARKHMFNNVTFKIGFQKT